MTIDTRRSIEMTEATTKTKRNNAQKMELCSGNGANNRPGTMLSIGLIGLGNRQSVVRSKVKLFVILGAFSKYCSGPATKSFIMTSMAVSLLLRKCTLPRQCCVYAVN